MQEVLMPNGERVSREQIRKKALVKGEKKKEEVEVKKELKEEIKKEVKEPSAEDIDHLNPKTTLKLLKKKAESLGLDVHDFNKTEVKEAIEEHLSVDL